MKEGGKGKKDVRRMEKLATTDSRSLLRHTSGDVAMKKVVEYWRV